MKSQVKKMPLVIIESPYAGNVETNMKYAHHCVKDCIARGESPYASHIMLTTALDDTVPHERLLGINAGLSIAHHADKVAVYTDLGITSGMEKGIEHHTNIGKIIEYREILKDNAASFVEIFCEVELQPWQKQFLESIKTNEAKS